MNKKRIFLLFIGIIIIVILIVIIMVTDNKKSTDVNSITNTAKENRTSQPEKVQKEKVDNSFEVAMPEEINIPGVNEVLSDKEKKEIAIPTVAIPVTPGNETKLRSFDIKGEGGIFTPSKIIVNLGDIVHVNFTAVDKDYDIIFPSYNMKQSVKIGQTKILEFQASKPGNFIYYCDVCGGPESEARGNFIIVE